MDVKEKEPITNAERRFLVYYKEVTKRGVDWSQRSAMLALGYKSKENIKRLMESLRKKGYSVETPRSIQKAYLRGASEAGISQEEKLRIKEATRRVHRL